MIPTELPPGPPPPRRRPEPRREPTPEELFERKRLQCASASLDTALYFAQDPGLEPELHLALLSHPRSKVRGTVAGREDISVEAQWRIVETGDEASCDALAENWYALPEVLDQLADMGVPGAFSNPFLPERVLTTALRNRDQLERVLANPGLPATDRRAAIDRFKGESRLWYALASNMEVTLPEAIILAEDRFARRALRANTSIRLDTSTPIPLVRELWPQHLATLLGDVDWEVAAPLVENWSGSVQDLVEACALVAQ